MLRIIVEDVEREDGKMGFNADVTCAGTEELIARQLTRVVLELAKRAPHILEIMNYLAANNIKLDEELGVDPDEI